MVLVPLIRKEFFLNLQTHSRQPSNFSLLQIVAKVETRQALINFEVRVVSLQQNGAVLLFGALPQ